MEAGWAVENVSMSRINNHVTDPSPAETGMGTSRGENFAPFPVPWYPIPVSITMDATAEYGQTTSIYWPYR